MTPEQISEKIKKEIENTDREIRNAEGMLKLRAIAEQYNGEYRLVWSEELLEKIKNRPAKTKYSTGISSIDALINGGFAEQQLITLSGSSGHGKTQFALYLVENMHELNPVMIPLEQSAEEIIEQRLENGYSIPRFLSPYKIASLVTPEWIELRVIEGIAKYNSKLFVIDHLGYIDAESQYQRETEAFRIEKKMQALKNIAKRWEVIILLLVHIKQKDESHPPSTHDLKGSSAILQESDLVCFVWRKNTEKNDIHIYEDRTLFSIQKNRRNGKNGNIGFVFNRTNGKYEPDNKWVESMIDMAQQAVEFNDF